MGASVKGGTSLSNGSRSCTIPSVIHNDSSLGTPEAPVVTVVVKTWQPWAKGESLELAGVTFQHLSDDEPYRIRALIVMDSDDTDETLHRRARATLVPAIDLLRRVMPRYPMEPESGYNVQRGQNGPNVGTIHIAGAAGIRQLTPLTPEELTPAKVAAKAYRAQNPRVQRRLRAAAYWLEQADVGPDVAIRAAASFFAIEAAIGSSGKEISNRYLMALQEMGFVFDTRARDESLIRIEALQQTRAALVHYGNLEPKALETHLGWARDLAHCIVGFKLGLPAPRQLEILDAVAGITPPST
jgi:hypothetical protein